MCIERNIGIFLFMISVHLYITAVICLLRLVNYSLQPCCIEAVHVVEVSMAS